MKAVNTPANGTDPAELLEAFVASNRSDKAFAALVGSLDRLVYSSALRRTGSAQLAEEVAQDVFAIMARKADSLRRHASLTAWALKTTKLRCGNAMRSERRRQRKIAALTSEVEAQDPLSSNAMDDQASWKDAVPFLDDALDRLSPLDQKLILERFYEEKKFREIAEANGKSEAACKRRVQRALHKISSFLTSRGVTLSGTTAVAALIGTEVARAVPAHTAAALAPNALAASTSFSTTALIANTLQTMGTTKTITATAAAVLVLFTFPLAKQRAEGNRMRSELDAIASAPAASDRQPAKRVTALSSPPRVARGGLGEARTAQSLLATLNRLPNNRTLIRNLITGDPLDKTTALARINAMSPGEVSALLDDTRSFPIGDYLKPLNTIDKFAPDQSPRARLERMVAGVVTSGYDKGGSSALLEWARSEPDAALAWYREKKASGDLFPGLNDDLYEELIGDLLYGLSESSPAQAFELYREVPRDEMNGSVPGNMASSIAKEIMESGDETLLVKMLDFHSGEDQREDRKRILSGAFGTFAKAGRFDEGMALVDRHNPVPEERNDYLVYLFTSALRLDRLEGGIDWVLASIPEPDAVEKTLEAFAIRDRWAALEWVNRQEPGLVRDVAHAAVARRMGINRNYQEALTNVENISDATLRAETLRSVGQRWLERDRESAEQGLPAELLQQLQNQ